MRGLKLTFILGILLATSTAYCQDETVPDNQDEAVPNSYDQYDLQEDSDLYPEEVEEQEAWDEGEPLPDDTEYFIPTEENYSF